MDNIVLTIAIPVFNGARFIEETIESILKADFNWLEVEFLVSDNHSTDNTVEIVSKYPGIRVIQNSQNIGYDRNVDLIFQEAKGTYVWTIGSDDLVHPDVYRNLRDLLVNQQDYSMIYVGRLNENKNIVPLRGSEFLLSTSFRSGFLSYNIINRQRWLMSERSKYLSSGWIHFAVILQIIRDQNAISSRENLVYENPKSTIVEKKWNKNGAGLLVGLNLVQIFARMYDYGYENSIIRQAKLIIKDAYPRKLILSKISGLKVDFDLIKRMVSLYKEFPSFWLVDLWILLTPGFFCKKFYKIYKLVNFNG